jgi:NAD(P)-dependent dehydrogenase (short-subunit alcohol dehydrogenase family)
VGAQIKRVCAPLGGLDVLANNAGIMAFRDKRTQDGYEVQMQTNQLSHVLLTHLLMPEVRCVAWSLQAF